MNLCSLLGSAPAEHRRAVAVAIRLPARASAEDIAAALQDPDRIAAIAGGLSPTARGLAAQAAFLGESVVEENWNRRCSNSVTELERHGLAFAFQHSYTVKYFVPAELHALLADALAAPYARDLAGAEAERWLEARLQPLHDMAALWAYLARSPVRVKTDRAVYKRDLPKLLEALPALELHDPDDVMATSRLNIALTLLVEKRLVRVRVDDLPFRDERRELVPVGHPAGVFSGEPEILRASLLSCVRHVVMAAPALALVNGLAPGATVDLRSFGAALRSLAEEIYVDASQVDDLGLAMCGVHYPWLAGAVGLGLNHDGLPTALRAAPASIPSAGRIVCQSNFELIALSPPTPGERFVLALTCEPVADQPHVFRLTRRSVQAAQRTGALEGGVVPALERLAGELPQNVVRSLADWTSSVRRPLRLRTAMMVDTGDPTTADELVASDLGRYVVERIGSCHLAIRADAAQAFEEALRRAGHELDAGVDRVSGRLGGREPMRTQADAMWEPDADGAPPEGRLISTIEAASAVTRPTPTAVPPGRNANGRGQLPERPDWQNDPVDVVLDAIERGDDLLIVYAGAQGTSLRQITPHGVEGAVVRAYCHMGGEERSFWLASIQEAVPLD